MKELSLNILDIAQNSIKAGAQHLEIELDQTGTTLTITITDDGHGMSPAFAAAAVDPFTTTRTTRKVGMGLPLFKMAAEQTGGTFSLESKQQNESGGEHGTRVSAVFHTDHVDCEPLGDIASTVTTLIQGNPNLTLTYVFRTKGGQKRLSTDDMHELLGADIPLNAPEVLAWVRDYMEDPELDDLE
jgi:hypothetical protein